MHVSYLQLLPDDLATNDFYAASAEKTAYLKSKIHKTLTKGTVLCKICTLWGAYKKKPAGS